MKKIVIAITGASGSIYAKRLVYHLEKYNENNPIELAVGLVLSKNAADVWQFELEEPMVFPPFIKVYAQNDFAAPFASGSAQYKHMVIIPCSMGTLGRIAHGLSDDLITRAADVILKERRQLICVLRDTPYNLIHIENMLKLTQAGGIILPASPSFYSKPTTFEELADTIVARVLDLMGIPISTYRWGESKK
ncbi:MAG: UbiX family flavin prenyltransferase [Bacteroidia bacterium]|nr:UbiX family flavin prenyltransferase [Bacteroidia bacterium]MDW8157336.1 UbiX family flavin prenyltransferase [Bacteroidia bacterium]